MAPKKKLYRVTIRFPDSAKIISWKQIKTEYDMIKITKTAESKPEVIIEEVKV